MKTPNQWVGGDGSLQIHMRNVIAEVQADCEKNPQANDLLSSALNEIINLQNKLARNEAEGSEGSVRRMRLKQAIKDYLPQEPSLRQDIVPTHYYDGTPKY